MAVKIFGTKKDSASARIYPGRINQKIEIPVSTRIMASPMEADTPRDSASAIASPEIAPEVIYLYLFLQYIHCRLRLYDKVTDHHSNGDQDKPIGKPCNGLAQIVFPPA